MKQKPQKAVVATVNYAGFEFPGLKLPNADYAISVPQIASMFQFLQKNSTRGIKRLIGNDFQFLRAASELNPKKVNIILLKDFGRLVNAIARSKDKAYEKARELAYALQDASVTMTLEQAYDLAFGNKQALEEYQEKHKARVQGKLTRRTLTDAIKDYIINHADEVSDNYKKWIYNNCTEAVNRLVFGRSAKKLKEDWVAIEVRSAMTTEELMIVDGVERLVVKLIDDFNFEPIAAIEEAGKRLLIKKIER